MKRNYELIAEALASPAGNSGAIYPARLFTDSFIFCPDCESPVNGISRIRRSDIIATKMHRMLPCMCEVSGYFAAAFIQEMMCRTYGSRSPMNDINVRAEHYMALRFCEIDARLAELYRRREAIMAVKLPGTLQAVDAEICAVIPEMTLLSNVEARKRAEELKIWKQTGRIQGWPKVNFNASDLLTVLLHDERYRHMPGTYLQLLAVAMYAQFKAFAVSGAPVSTETRRIASLVIPAAETFLKVNDSELPSLTADGESIAQALQNRIKRRVTYLDKPKDPPK